MLTIRSARVTFPGRQSGGASFASPPRPAGGSLRPASGPMPQGVPRSARTFGAAFRSQSIEGPREHSIQRSAGEGVEKYSPQAEKFSEERPPFTGTTGRPASCAWQGRGSPLGTGLRRFDSKRGDGERDNPDVRLSGDCCFPYLQIYHERYASSTKIRLGTSSDPPDPRRGSPGNTPPGPAIESELPDPSQIFSAAS